MDETVAPGRWRRLELWVPAAIIVLDQITKAIVRATLPLHEGIEVIPGFLNLTHIRNTGAAFGMLNAADFPYKTLIISLVALGGLVGVTFYTASLPREQMIARLGLSLVIGGAAGNLIDRLVEGSVVDFIDAYWGPYHFWAFNVADSAITIGVVTMLLDVIGVGKRVSTTA
jgi:signal peptidase II